MSFDEIALKNEIKESMMKRRDRKKVEIRVIVEKLRGLLDEEEEEEEERDSHAPISMKLPPAKAIEKRPIVFVLMIYDL